MKLLTKHFGEIELSEDKLITFEEGIFGFETLKKFVLLYDNDVEENPFCWLQSAENVEVALPLIKPMTWFLDYSPDVADEDVASIGELKAEDLDVFTVVVIPTDITQMTTNLKAPILVNLKTHKAVQSIANNDIYDLRVNLYNQIKANQQSTEEGGQ